MDILSFLPLLSLNRSSKPKEIVVNVSFYSHRPFDFVLVKGRGGDVG